MTTPARRPIAVPSRGVRLAGTGRFTPEKRLTNADLERIMDTSDEWIVQRTGIRERRICDPDQHETCTGVSAAALQRALQDAKIPASELDLIIVATVSAEMACPSVACRVGAMLGSGTAGAFDLAAACCGFVYAMNLAHDLIRVGTYRTVGVVGCDTLSEVMDYSTEGRQCAIIFGDGAGAAVLRATDDASKGVIAQSTHADGRGWEDLYIPRKPRDVPPHHDPALHKPPFMQMNGRAVFKFAVSTFPQVIQETLDKAGIAAGDVDQYVCHQSNVRILDAARERFGLPPDKLYVNIDRFGNTSAGSVPICLDELRAAGKIREGSLIMLVAFGGGLTWSSSLWQL